MKNKKRIVAAMLCTGLVASAMPMPTSASANTSNNTETEWNEVQDIISQYYGEWNEPDTAGILNSRIPNTALLGNGDVGISSAGNAAVKQFLISKSDFWEYNGNPANSQYGSPLLIGTYSIAEAGDSSTINLARSYKKVTTSSLYTTDKGVLFQPEYAVDGQSGGSADAEYRGWVSGVYSDINWTEYKQLGNKYIATGNAAEWLQLEFDEAITFNRYVLTSNSYVHGSDTWNSRDFQIQISNDGKDWQSVSSITGNTEKVLEVKLSETVTAKYVRVYITNPGIDPRARIVEFELYCDKAVGIQNLAPTYKNVTASSTNVGASVEKAVSGSWTKGEESWSSGKYGEGIEDWIMLEFHQPITFNRYVLVNDGASRGTGANINTKDFQVQISDDGEAWTTVSSITGNNKDIVEEKLNKSYTAKFVRLFITKSMIGSDPRARVIQFELYCDKTATGSIQNLARTYEEVTASSFYEYEKENSYFPPEYAVDGQLGDSSNAGYRAWVSDICKDINWTEYKQLGNKYIATGNAPEWLQLKFATPISFNRWVLTNDSATRGVASYDTIDCQIMISDDGETWTTVSELKDNKLPIVEVKMDTTVTATYVRLNITNPGYDPRARVGEFELYCDADTSNSTFHEIEDILNAEVRTEMTFGGQDVEMKTWMAATKNIMITELSGVKAPVALQLNLAPNSGGKDIRPIEVDINEDGSVTMTRETALVDGDKGNLPVEDIILAEPYTSKAAVTSKIIGAASTASLIGDSASLEFTLNPNEKVYIVTAIEGGGQTYDKDGNLWTGRTEPTADAAALLATVNSADDVDALHDAHLNWWKEYWLQSYISLDTNDADLAVIQKYYYAAQYMLGCSLREGKVAPGLYGVWHANDNASWHSDYHMNYNFISTFYGLATSNRASMLLPATEALLDYVEQGKANAASTEELRYIFPEFVDELVSRGQVDPVNGIQDAIVYPVAIGPYGMTIENHAYLQETADAAYSIYPLIEYYNYTLDEEFLEDSLYPYIKLVLNFLEHWAIKNDDGTYTIFAAAYEGWGTDSFNSRCAWSKDPAFELNGYKNCLRYGIKFSKQFDDGNWEKWEEIYNGLADQPTTTSDGKTVLALADEKYRNGEWSDMTDMSYNAIPLDSIIPGEVYGYYSSAEDLKLLYNTVQWYDARDTWGVTNNFPRIFTYAINSRYPAALVVKEMAAVIRDQMQANLMIDDEMHGIEKAGATEAVNNMLLLEDKGVIKLFGNWLKNKDAKFVRLRAPGALVFSAEYDGAANQIVEGATMYSEVGATATVASFWDEEMIVLDSKGNRVSTTIGTAPNHDEEITYTFDTVAGETYTFKKGSLFSDITLDKSNIDLNVGDSATITATTENGEELEWTSNNDSIVTVKNGVITAVAVGTAIITVKIVGSLKKATCTVTVKEAQDFSALLAAIESTKSLNPDDYTASSWVVLDDTLEEIEPILNNPETTQAEIDAALKLVQNAINGLTKVSNNTIFVPIIRDDTTKSDDTAEKIDGEDQNVGSDELKFSDVDKDDWFYEDVKYVVENNIMNGVGGDTFAPESSLTRAMIVTILYRMEGEPPVADGSRFSDVEDGQWYTKGVEWAAENGIVNGIGENAFAPNEPLTREQLATIFYRYAKTKSDELNYRDLSKYTDVADISEYAKSAMAWAVAEDLIIPNDGKLLPAGEATRADVAHAIAAFSGNFNF